MASAASRVASPGAAPAASVPSPRDSALDFVKGALVLVMVAYHTMNVFSTAPSEAYGPIRFVSGSFIFMAGFIVARFQQDAFLRDGLRTSLRLVERGAKLVVLFTVLNLVIMATGVGNPDKVQRGIGEFVANAYAIYVMGDARAASFQILLPIGYLLMISPLALAFHRFRWALAAAALAAVLGLQQLAIQWPNLELGLIGIVGTAAGILVRGWRAGFTIRSKAALAGGLVIGFLLMGPMSATPITYVLSILLVAKLFYDAGAALGSSSGLARALELLGRYSLVAYIAQIVLLQVASRIAGRPKWELGPTTLVVGVAAAALLWISIVLLDRVLRRSALAARCYRAVFS